MKTNRDKLLQPYGMRFPRSHSVERYEPATVECKRCGEDRQEDRRCVHCGSWR